MQILYNCGNGVMASDNRSAPAADSFGDKAVQIESCPHSMPAFDLGKLYHLRMHFLCETPKLLFFSFGYFIFRMIMI